MIIVKHVVLKVVRDMLRENLANVFQQDKNIRAMLDERCPPTCGEEFIGIYGGDTSNLNDPAFITKLINVGFTVGITRKMQGVPNEMAGEQVLTVDEDEGDPIKMAMYARADEIVTALLSLDGWELANRINAITCDGTGGSFIKPFGFMSVDPIPRKVQADHFDIEDNESSGLRYAGLLLEIEFGGAEYIKASPPPVVTP